MALLHMLKAISHRFQLRLVVAHLNHGMRPEAGIEEAAVKDIAEAWSISFESRTVDVRDLKTSRGISEEEAGRTARYSLLFDTAHKYGASKIALGHHLDDQAETVLLNIIRGTGVDGMAGILPAYKRGGIKLVRPLLCLRRHEIEAYCKENDLRTFTDSTNLETDYTRNRLRLDLIPRLEEEYNPRIREALYGLAVLAYEDRQLLQALARKKYLELAGLGRQETIFNRKDLSSLPLALSSRILRIAHKKYAPAKELDRFHVEKIMELITGEKTTAQITLPGDAVLYLSQSQVFITGARQVSGMIPVQNPLQLPGKTYLPGGSLIEARVVDKADLTWPPSKYQACLDYQALPPGELTVRPRWPGALFHPQGSGGKKKLKDFLIDQKIPRHRRDQIPLVTVGSEIIWVVGLRIAHPYRVTGQTEKVLQLEFKKQRMPGRRKIC